MAVKRDRANRVFKNAAGDQGFIVLPVSKVAGLGKVKAGDRITLTHVVEDGIFPYIKDAHAYGAAGNPETDATVCGDAIFDSMASGAENAVFDPDLLP